MTNIKELREKIKDLTVLFVDDEEEIREGTGTFLKKFFTKVFICKDGKEGLELYQQISTQIVITDLMMPNMDGMEMAKQIKTLNTDVFIIFITAYRDIVEDDLKLIDMHIKKPLSYEDMAQILNIIAEKYGK